jgi:hypothetical protein
MSPCGKGRQAAAEKGRFAETASGCRRKSGWAAAEDAADCHASGELSSKQIQMLFRL